MQQTQTAWYQTATAQSTQGREIILYLSKQNYIGPLDTLVMAAFHGDEPESEVVVRTFFEQADSAEWGDKVIGIIPVVNPDGLAARTRVTANKVDLNRNFPTKDWAEQEKDTIYYSGPSAASEPETKFLLEVLEKWPPKKIVSVHTPYRVINIDGPAKELAEAMAAVNGYPVTEDIGYATPGSFGTYTGKERGIAVLTLELPENEAFTETELKNNVIGINKAILF